MSVSLSRSTSFCSHTPSSPSCSPSPRRLQSPTSSNRKANIPRSTANSPLPFLVTKSDKSFAYLGGAQDARACLNTTLTGETSTSSHAATTPIRRGRTKDVARLTKRKQIMTPAPVEHQVVSSTMVMSSTPLAHSTQAIESSSWTRRRGRTVEAEKDDSSSGSEQDMQRDQLEDASSELSPIIGGSSERDSIATIADAQKASLNFASLVAAEEDGLPSPRRTLPNRGMASLLFSAHGLERNFESKVSMTPPARLSHNYNESPFTTAGLLAYPATEAKKISIPRSNAFGPHAPLPMESGQFKSMRRNIPIHARSAFANDGLQEQDQDEEGTGLIFHKEVGSLDGVRRTRARTEGTHKRGSKAVSPLKTVQEPRRRAATMLKSNKNPFEMDMDESEENDEVPPPSPSPAGELSFPKRFNNNNVSEGELSSDSEGEGAILRPGARLPSMRMSSSRSISTSHCQDYLPSMIGFGGEIPVRSLTTSAIKHTHASQSSISTSNSSSKFSSQGSSSHHNKSSTSSSPYRTPNKRRARMPSSSSATKSYGMLNVASPIAVPIESEEGSLFATPAKEEASEKTSTKEKRRSTGSFMPSTPNGSNTRLFIEPGSPVTSLPSFTRSKRSSLPPLAPETLSQRRMALSKMDNYIGANTPGGNYSFDDSGVAIISPAAAPSMEKMPERGLGRYLGLGISRAPESPGQSSPSKVALARRAASDNHFNLHPFKVRERSALANETRLNDGDSSTPSSPDVAFRSARVGSACSVPEGLASPARHSANLNRRTSLGVEETHGPYLTPQNYKNILPLQTAFMSTGLASKRNRPTMGTVDSVTGEVLAPLPPMPNFSLNNAGLTTIAQVGLREVVAAANAHSAAGNKPATMPDTPMKKPVFPSFAVNVSKTVQNEASKFKGHTHPILPSMLSPPPKVQADINDSSSSGGSAYGGDSPLLNQECDSPTLGLASVSGKTAWSSGPPRVGSPFRMQSNTANNNNMSVSPTQSISPRKGAALHRPNPNIQLCVDTKETAVAEDGNQSNNNLSAVGPPRQPVLRGMSILMHQRPSLGLQRKSSFGPSSDQGLSLNGSSAISPLLGNDFIPTTPTRNSASVKWFEAAQLMTTPSPSSRRRGAKNRRDSYITANSNRSSRLRLSIGAVDPNSAKSMMQSDKVYHFESRFTSQSLLGQGEFSQVLKVEDKIDGSTYAVKRMKKPYLGSRDRLRKLEEVDILRHLSQDGGHLNIISFVDAWEESGSLYVQMELCPCVDFSSFLQHNANMGGSLEEARLWKVFRELNDGLHYIHEKGVLHLDLKPANVFITEIATLKIGDFGLATRWPTVDANTILQGAGMGDAIVGESNALMMKKGYNLEREGDREYIAPEIIFDGKYSKAADIFSLGLIMLEAAGNVILPDNGEAWQKLRSDDLGDVDLSMISNSLIRLIEACMQSDSEKRPTTDQIQQHPVLQAVNKKVALGVHVSELDQLPVFNLPSGDSSQSLTSKLRSQNREGSGDSSNDAIDIEMEDGDIKPMERTLSTQTALGIMGVRKSEDDDLDKVLDIRGALIHETIHFLIDVLEADPDPSARLFQEDYSPVAPPANLPIIKLEGEIAGSSLTANTLQHVAFRASPLRQHEMDVD